MRKPAALVLAAACILGCPKPAAAQSAAAPLPELQARYKLLQAAIGSGDQKAVAAFLAPRFVGIDVAGETDGAKALLAGLEVIPGSGDTVSMTIASVKRRGAFAIVTRRLEIQAANPDALEDARGAEFVAFSTDTWIEAGGTWLLQKSTAQQLAYYVDGEQIARDVSTQ